MPSFEWGSTFREGQWRVLREFVTQERKDCGNREKVILAEQSRIGRIIILYGADETTGIRTEERIGVLVEGVQGCAIGKLLQAYVALGGNPFDISMFLVPNQATVSEEGTLVDDQQPGLGVAYRVGFSYSFSSANENSDSNLSGFQPSVVGGEVETGEERVWTPIKQLRGWTKKEMYQKRVRLEERIIKLSDLYEQLNEELSEIVQATRGEGMKTSYDPVVYSEKLCVQYLVYAIDSAFRQPSSDGTVEPYAQQSSEQDGYPNLVLDKETDKYHTL